MPQIDRTFLIAFVAAPIACAQLESLDIQLLSQFARSVNALNDILTKPSGDDFFRVNALLDQMYRIITEKEAVTNSFEKALLSIPAKDSSDTIAARVKIFNKMRNIIATEKALADNFAIILRGTPTANLSKMSSIANQIKNNMDKQKSFSGDLQEIASSLPEKDLREKITQAAKKLADTDLQIADIVQNIFTQSKK